jgi:hypothetical protein
MFCSVCSEQNVLTECGRGKKSFCCRPTVDGQVVVRAFHFNSDSWSFFLCVCAAADKTVKTKKRYMCERAHLWLGDRSLWAMIGNGGKFRNQIKVSFIIFFPLFFHKTNQSAWYYSRKKWTFCLCQPIQFEDGAATK